MADQTCFQPLVAGASGVRELLTFNLGAKAILCWARNGVEALVVKTHSRQFNLC
jgi:hypothetical protein